MTYSWDDQTSDADLHHFEVYFSNGSEATPLSHGYFNTYSRTYKGNNLITGEGKILDLLDVKNGDTVYITVIAVDASGNKSEAAKTSAVYNLDN